MSFFQQYFSYILDVSDIGEGYKSLQTLSHEGVPNRLYKRVKSAPDQIIVL